MTRCKICEREIEGQEAWFNHVEAHKRKYLSANGRNPEEYRAVKWDDVLRFFKPSIFTAVEKEKPQSKIIDFGINNSSRKNPNCKLADTRRIFFKCNPQCKYYAKPDTISRQKGLFYLHQKMATLSNLPR